MLSNFPDIYNATMMHLNKEQNIISTRLFLMAKEKYTIPFPFDDKVI